jgi:phosphatidylserine decarboxylase
LAFDLPTMNDQRFIQLLSVLPKSALSTAVGAATRLPAPPMVHQAAIRAFVRRYDVQADEAEQPLERYRTFAEFFTRRLKPGLRPIAAGERVVASPVDGAVSQVGYSEAGQCLQAKGISFPLERLLGTAEAAKPFEGGAYATLYLAPRDYHRIHSPLSGEIDGYTYLPGQFWPVNRASVHHVPALFCLNERLITYLRTSAGRCAVVKVGATCVARIRATYDEVVTHTGGARAEARYSAPKAVKKGDELGVFEMGSTVILLFEPGRVRWRPEVKPEAVVRMGQALGDAT